MTTGRLPNDPVEGVTRKIEQIKKHIWLQELAKLYLSNSKSKRNPIRR